MKTQAQLDPFADRFQYAQAFDQWVARGKDNAFEAMRRDQCRRERTRLITNGTIVPLFQMKPQLLIRDNDFKGGWKPEIKTHE